MATSLPLICRRYILSCFALTEVGIAVATVLFFYSGTLAPAFADDGQKGRLVEVDRNLGTASVQVRAHSKSDTGYVVNIKGTASSPGQQGLTGEAAATSSQPGARLNNQPTLSVIGSPNSGSPDSSMGSGSASGQAERARPATSANPIGAAAADPSRLVTSGAGSNPSASIPALPGQAALSSAANAGDENPSNSASSPRVFTYQELLATSQQTPNAAIPVWVGGIQPIRPRNAAVDNFGNVWFVPPAPASSDSNGADDNSTSTGQTGSTAGSQGAGAQPDLTAQSPAVAAIDPRAVAVELEHDVPLPGISVHMNPEMGLVALPAWFWVENYDGSTISSARTGTIPPLIGADVPVDVVPIDDPRRQATSFTVEVHIWPTQYVWSFGDGATMVSRTLGQRYPQESEVQHTFEFSSLQTGGGFPVSLTVSFAADYRVDGGQAQPLPPTQRTFEARYNVQEAQTVLTKR